MTNAQALSTMIKYMCMSVCPHTHGLKVSLYFFKLNVFFYEWWYLFMPFCFLHCYSVLWTGCPVVRATWRNHGKLKTGNYNWVNNPVWKEYSLYTKFYTVYTNCIQTTYLLVFNTFTYKEYHKTFIIKALPTCFSQLWKIIIYNFINITSPVENIKNTNFLYIKVNW